ncbi:MAG: hypothetical protein LBR65_08615 [Culturomica sp.]|nr:hypothetical protein [Culturomica sp.]
MEALEQNNFPNQKQVDLLRLLNYALFKKQYPQDLCGILDRKIQLLQQPTETSEKDHQDVASIKVRSVIILELLNKLQLGTAYNDLSKICKLIAFLIGNSYNNIYNQLQKGIYFCQFHTKQIDEANKILSDLNTSISIDKNKQY